MTPAKVKHQIEMEEAHAFGDLAPGREHRHDAEPDGQEDQQQAEAIQAEMEAGCRVAGSKANRP